MKVQELVEKYNKNPRIDIAKAIEAKQYVGIAFKQRMASLVLDSCTTIVDGEIHIDSVEKYILFTIAVINMHTNLEFTNSDDENYSPLADYDLLCESGLLIKIIDTFRDDYASCQEILNMMTADKMQNNATIEKKIGNLLEGIENIVSESIGGLIEKLNLDDLAGDLPIDQNKLLELFSSTK